MEYDWHYINSFLDVTEFVMVNQANQTQNQSEIYPIPQSQKVQTHQIDDLSAINYLSPYTLAETYVLNHQNFQELKLGTLNQDQQSLEASEQSIQNEESQINIWNQNRDLLDVIQQEYEILHQRKLKEMASKFPSNNKTIDHQDQQNKKQVEQTTCSGLSSTETNGNIKYYDFLSFKENNIQFYHQGNAKYLNQSRKDKVERYFRKRHNRNWGKKISYFCRKQVADARLRVKGRFVTRVQANKLLGMDTSTMSLQTIKTMLESKFHLKDKDDEQGSQNIFGISQY